jgi:hypothetical protein
MDKYLLWVAGLLLPLGTLPAGEQEPLLAGARPAALQPPADKPDNGKGENGKAENGQADAATPPALVLCDRTGTVIPTRKCITMTGVAVAGWARPITSRVPASVARVAGPLGFSMFSSFLLALLLVPGREGAPPTRVGAVQPAPAGGTESQEVSAPLGPEGPPPETTGAKSAPNVSPAPGGKPATAVFPPTYSNSPTPLGDFLGPAFGPSTPDRMPLMALLQGTWPGSLLDGTRTQVTGWTDMTYNASSAHNDNRPLGFNYRANEFLLQQNVLRVVRPIDTGSKEFDWGFLVDNLLGADYRYTLAKGFLFGQLRDRNQLYGFDVPQFYADLWFPQIGQGTDVKVGRLSTQWGAESFLAVNNIFSSHTYINLFTPFTHTGVLATTRFCNNWYAQYGICLGGDAFIDPIDVPTFLAGLKWVSDSNTNSVYFACMGNGAPYHETRQFDNVQIYDVAYTHVWTPRFQTINEAFFAYQTRVPDLNMVTWYGSDMYLQYDFTPRLYGAIRPAVFVDSQGQRTGLRGVYTTLTAGLTFKPRKWLYLRPELRFDHNYGPVGPYEGRHSLFNAIQDVISRW